MSLADVHAGQGGQVSIPSILLMAQAQGHHLEGL